MIPSLPETYGPIVPGLPNAPSHFLPGQLLSNPAYAWTPTPSNAGPYSLETESADWHLASVTHKFDAAETVAPAMPYGDVPMISLYDPPAPPPRVYPKNGLLSGMILTAATAAAALTAGIAFPGFTESFNVPMPEPLLDSFFLSLGLMVAHKAESYFTREYDVCPVYLTNGQASWGINPRQAMFVSFVSTFIGMSFVNYLSLKGGHWPMLMLSVWMAQGLHELHHSAKSLAQKAYYAGTASAILFTAQIDAFVFPQWREGLGLSPAWDWGFYALQAPVFLAYYLEHRGWLKKAGLTGAER